MGGSLGPPQAPRRGRAWRTGGLLFLGLLALYHVNGRNHSGVDTIGPAYTAWALARHGSLDLRAYPEVEGLVGTHVRQLPDGRRVSIRPPGSALAAVPVLIPFALWSEQPPRQVNLNHLGKLAGAAWVAGAAVFFFFLCRRLAPAGAWPATVLFALGTCLWSVASQALWMHGPAVFWLSAALYGLVTLDDERGLSRGGLIGFALGMAVLTRPTTALFGLAGAAALLKGRRWGPLAGLALGAALPVGSCILLNWQLFGSPVLGGYEQDDWNSHTPLWLGVSGLLVAPSRGLLVYSPALLLAPAGVAALFRRPDAARRDVLLGWLAAAAATLVFYARWHDWRGGWCFGPRFLCETLPVGCALFAVGYEALRPGWARRGARVLVALSVAVHLVGVFGDRESGDWNLRHSLPDQGRCLFALRDTQIEAQARGVLHGVARRLRP